MPRDARDRREQRATYLTLIGLFFSLFAAFSRRDSVGWLARSASLAGSRPQASLSSGSERSVSASSWSSYPQAIWNTRWADKYLNAPLHIIIAGRAGYEYDMEEDVPGSGRWKVGDPQIEIPQ